MRELPLETPTRETTSRVVLRMFGFERDEGVIRDSEIRPHREVAIAHLPMPISYDSSRLENVRHSVLHFIIENIVNRPAFDSLGNSRRERTVYYKLSDINQTLNL